MFAGHFGVAAAVKAKQPNVPLWALMVSTQLLDIAFIPLFVMGIEPIETSGGYGNAIIHAEYTHSLIGALLLALVAGLAAAKAWGKREGITIGAVVFSHWLLDLLVHRADLPVLPGNAGGLPLMGLGLWATPAASAAVELVLIAAGFILYVQSLRNRSIHMRRRAKVWAASTVMGVLLTLSLVTDFFGL